MADYRAPILRDIGGVLEGVVTLDPDITDIDAVRSLISSDLYDGEKLSGAYGGQYFWVPKYGDSRRVEDRGFRVRYVTTFAPPSSGTYRLQFFGYGETTDLPASLPAVNVMNAIRAVDPEDLGAVDVTKNADATLTIDLKARIGMGSTAGTIIGQSGVGVCLMNRDFSQPLKRGTKWFLSPKVPFTNEDGVTGIHACINQALNDITVKDLFPIWATLPAGGRPRVIAMRDWAPWMLPSMITGFYAPTDWQMTAYFQPPTSGTYTLTLVSWQPYGPIATPLPHGATGEQIQTALASIPGVSGVTVSPLGAASSYTVAWRTMFHNSQLQASNGVILDTRNDRLSTLYQTVVRPAWQSDFETASLYDPGYPEGQTWFVEVERPGGSRICPQTFPRKADGSLDTTKDPIPGTQWMESTQGLVNDLDQAFPTVDQVYLPALRYVYDAIAMASPRGEADEWIKAGQRAAAQAAGRIVYGPITRRGGGVGPSWPGVGIQQKGWGWWQP